MSYQIDPRRLTSMTERIAWLIDQTWGTRKDAAEALDVHPALVSRWATNPERPPGEESILRLATLAGSTPWWIRYGRGMPFPQRVHAGAGDTGIQALIDEYSSADSVLRHARPEDVLRASFRAAMTEGWGAEAIAQLTDAARRILTNGGSVLDLISS